MSGKTQAMRDALERPAAEGPRWFVVQCHANHERIARQNLINAGYDVYLPMRLCPHPKARHPITPFFPRYLFVRFDPSITRWLEIISTVGVHDIVRKVTSEGRVPRSVPDRMIDTVRSWEVDGVIHLLGAPRRCEPVFKPGDKVRVTEGPFAGYEGLVSIANDNNRVVIMLGLVERGESPHKVRMQSGHLEGAALRTPSEG